MSRQERARWRLTFRRLAEDSLRALAGDDVVTAARAVNVMVDLACETKSSDYFRSEDPMEAARFVVSDSVAAMWTRMRDTKGADHMVKQAVVDLVRWEQRYGWTRRGDGRVSEKEASLASTLARFLVIPDLWTLAAQHYVEVLDDVARKPARSRRGRGGTALTRDLSEWNTLLVARLAGSEHDELVDRIATHPAFAGPELTVLQAQVARQRGDLVTPYRALSSD